MNKLIIINYIETLRILYRYLNIPKGVYESGLNTILERLVVNYLSNQLKSDINQENKLLESLDYYGLRNFESSELAYFVSNSIITTTSIYLPGFKSYDNDCMIDEKFVGFYNGYSAWVLLDEKQLNKFTSVPEGFFK